MQQKNGGVHDVLGVGLGPFDLSLACLKDLDAVFLGRKHQFSWQDGSMIAGEGISWWSGHIHLIPA